MTEPARVEKPLEDNMLPAILIQLMRLYDIQMTLIGLQSPQHADMLQSMHERGEYLCPPPAIAYDDVTDE
jgi:hypothetical protein